MKTLCSIAFAIFSVAASGQEFVNESHDIIEWNEYYDLTWDDFLGEPARDSNGDAATAVNIKAKPYYVKKQIMYDVDVLFNRKQSWKREQSQALLKHEQLHFDIAELYARMIRKKVADLQQKGINDIKIYNTAIRQLLEESNEADQRYDLETLHGALTKKQGMWEHKVQEQLSGLKDFKKKKKIIAKDLKKRDLIFG